MKRSDDDRVTGSPPPPLPPLQPDGPGEFEVVVVHAKTGREFPAFLVGAADEEVARKLCQRNYLVIESVKRFVHVEGQEGPRRLPYGPPISDKDFEHWYTSQPADRPAGPSETSLMGMTLGWLFCGPLGALLGWHLGREE